MDDILNEIDAKWLAFSYQTNYFQLDLKLNEKSFLLIRQKRFGNSIRFLKQANITVNFSTEEPELLLKELVF